MGKKMHRICGVLYDTHMEDVPMIAVRDRLLRQWKREIAAGTKPALVARVAQEMETAPVVAERIIDIFLSERKVYVKRKD